MSTAEYAPDDAYVEPEVTPSQAQAQAQAQAQTQLPFSQVFTEALRGVPCTVEGLSESTEDLPMHQWSRPVDDSDRAVLRHCHGATIDVGCGPGRMGEHLRHQGHAVLGVDIVHEAVAQARDRGVPALRRNVFDPIPGEGRWDTALLADGNIGIGGAPRDLLARCGELVVRGAGRVVADLAGPGTGLTVHEALLVSGGRRTRSFPWARVGVDAIEELAETAGLCVERVGRHGERWFAVLVHAG